MFEHRSERKKIRENNETTRDIELTRNLENSRTDKKVPIRDI